MDKETASVRETVCFTQEIVPSPRPHTQRYIGSTNWSEWVIKKEHIKWGGIRKGMRDWEELRG